MTCSGSPERTESEEPPDRLQGRVLIFAGVVSARASLARWTRAERSKAELVAGVKYGVAGACWGGLPVRELVGEISLFFSYSRRPAH